MGFRLHWNGKVLAFTAVFLPVTIVLGFWQLQRAEEKRHLAASYEDRSGAHPVELSQLTVAEDLQYVRVKTSGEVDNRRTLLLENRVKNGQPGYEVVSPLLLQDGTGILVNRGWIAGSLDRQRLPEIPPVENPAVLMGYLYRSPGKPLVLGEERWTGKWPQRLQNPDLADIGQKLGLRLHPYVLRLDAGSPAALAADWQIINVQPEKHTAYAVQWFAMAVALVILSLFANSNLGTLLRRKTKG